MTGSPLTPAPPPISAVIITRNAERHLADVLAACEFCAERLVLDSGSTDGTETIVREAGARFERQEFLGYGPQKRRAVELAQHDWILAIDADEVLDEAARRAIAGLDFTDPAACWQFSRRTFIGRRGSSTARPRPSSRWLCTRRSSRRGRRSCCRDRFSTTATLACRT
jgi:glycosyltransferase involved in cell wall biosynthesis